MGLFLGRAVAPAILIALLAGVLVGAVVIARKGAAQGARPRFRSGRSWRSARSSRVFVGQPLVDLYVNHFLYTEQP